MSYTCKECKHEGTLICSTCANPMGMPTLFEPAPRTRGEKLRDMTDGELAAWFKVVIYPGCTHCPAMQAKCCKGWEFEGCEENLFDFLSEEAEL